MPRRRSICRARTSCRSFAVKERPSRGSISRATCMDSVEAPETMRPLLTNCTAARPARWDRCRDAARSADPHRRSACGRTADRHPSPSSSAASGPPDVAKARSNWPSASSTSVETVPRLFERRRKGAVGRVEAKGTAPWPATRLAEIADAEICAQSRHYSSCLTTSMRPVAVRAENCGRYMSSTLAAGWS